MPLIKKTNLLNSQIFFWNITESLSTLKQLYPPKKQEKIHLEQLNFEIKQKHFLLLRFLLKKENINPEELYYTNNGKPMLYSKKHLSVSHSKNIFCLALSSLPIGVDIEQQTPRILKVAPKFTQWTAPSLTEQEQIEAFTKIWTIKEALYKAHNAIGANFTTQLIINEPFTLSKNTFEGLVFFSPTPTPYRLYTSTLSNFAWSIAVGA